MRKGARSSGGSVRRAVLAAGLGMPVLALTVWPTEAKAPGATWCYRDVCHRVRTVGETQRLVGKTVVMEASFYDEPRFDRFNRGKHTSNGEVFDARNPARVAAANFPDGTELLLRNPENGRTSHVRVNDFGPFLRSRLLDVTKRVAQDLDFAYQGVTKLEVTVIAAPPPEEIGYRKNRVSLPARGYLGAPEAGEIANITRTLIAAAQQSVPSVASTVPQGGRAASASSLLASYDLVGRVRAILGMPHAASIADLERDVMASETGVPDAQPSPERALDRLSRRAVEQQAAAGGQATGAASESSVIVAALVEIGEQTLPLQRLDDRNREPHEPRLVAAADAEAATLVVAPPPAPAAPQAPAPEASPALGWPSPTEPPPPLVEVAGISLHALVLPPMPQTPLRDVPSAQDIQPSLVVAVARADVTPLGPPLAPIMLMSETVTTGLVPTALGLMAQAPGTLHGWASGLGGRAPNGTQMLLLALVAALGSALLYASWQARARRPVAGPRAAGAVRAAMPGFARMVPAETERNRAAVQVAPSAATAMASAGATQPPPDGSVIAGGITVIGDVASRGSLTVAGLIRGRVRADTLVVLDGGRIEGPVEARIVRCAGAIDGPVSAAELNLGATARYRGAVAVITLSVESGADFEADVSRRPAAG